MTSHSEKWIARVERVVNENPGGSVSYYANQLRTVSSRRLNEFLFSDPRGHAIVKSGKLALPAVGPRPGWSELKGAKFFPRGTKIENLFEANKSMLDAFKELPDSTLTADFSDSTKTVVAILLSGGSYEERMNAIRDWEHQQRGISQQVTNKVSGLESKITQLQLEVRSELAEMRLQISSRPEPGSVIVSPPAPSPNTNQTV